MHVPEPSIVIQRFTEAHLEGVAALYNEPAVCRQVLQMPFQSVEMWRKRLVMDNERRLQLVALQGAEVIGQLGLEQYLRVRQSHVGSLGMGVAPAWQGKGVGSRLLAAAGRRSIGTCPGIRPRPRPSARGQRRPLFRCARGRCLQRPPPDFASS